MAIFYYKAIDPNGTKMKGTIHKNSKEQVFAYLKSMGYLPISIRKQNFLTADLEDIRRAKTKISPNALSFLSRQLSFFVTSGVSIHKGISIIIQGTKQKILREKLLFIDQQLQSGKSLSQAVARQAFFPSLFISMLRVGEETGDLAPILCEMASYYDAQATTKKEIKNAMVYPMLVSSLLGIVILFCVVVLIPNYLTLFEGQEDALPWVTRAMFGVSQWILQNGMMLGGLFTIVVIVVYYWLQTEQAKEWKDRIKLHIPAYRLWMNYQITQVFGVLLGAGIPILGCFEIVQDVLNNRWIKKEFSNIYKCIQKGQPLSKSMRLCPTIDILVIGMVEVGEETGFLTETFAHCADYYQTQMNALQKQVNQLIEPILLLVLGVFLLFVVLAVLLPTFSLAKLL